MSQLFVASPFRFARVQFTNWQSRTALVIMPALFVFTLTSEQKMLHRMEEVAQETEHAIRSVEWADQEHRKKAMEEDVEQQRKAQELRQMYRQSILQSGVRVVDTPTLQWYHQGANYVQANPFKVILGIGVPAIVGIFYGKSGKEHCTYFACALDLCLLAFLCCVSFWASVLYPHSLR